MNAILALHEEAKARASNFRDSENRLIEILCKIDEKKGFRLLGYSNMHVYCVKALSLSDAQAYSMVAVARKSKEIPELKELLEDKKMTLANATQLIPVITRENKQDLLQKAQDFSKRELAREIKKSHPDAVPKSRIKPITDGLSEARLVISTELEENLKRLQDIYCKKTNRSLSLVDALALMATELLDRHDPVRKAQRNLRKRSETQRNLLPAVKHMVTEQGGAKESKSRDETKPAPLKNTSPPHGRVPFTAQIRHAVSLRDKGQCCHKYSDGKRCEEKRWIQVHHIKPVSEGGTNAVSNLQTLCYNHHRYTHEVRLKDTSKKFPLQRLEVFSPK